MSKVRMKSIPEEDLERLEACAVLVEEFLRGINEGALITTNREPGRARAIWLHQQARYLVAGEAAALAREEKP